MAKTQIRVTVNMPTTPEGKAKLEAAMVRFNSMMLAGALNAHPEIPYVAKLRYIKSLNGVVPWAKPKEARETAP